MSPFPRVRREPEVDERRGLDGNGAMRAADLPSTSYTWGYLAAPAENEDIDLEEDLPVTRTLCLALSDDRTLPLQCKFKLDHLGDHDWQIEGTVLTDFRAQLLRDEQDSPSGMLPRRTPGVALGDVEGECGATDRREAAGASEGESTVIERWTA